MAATQRQTQDQQMIDLLALSQDLAKLDPRQCDGLAQKIVTTISRHMHTDRVSLAIHDKQGHVLRVASTGFQLKRSWLAKPGKVYAQVHKSLKPLCISNIHEYPELASDRLKEYRTDAFAVFPVCGGSPVSISYSTAPNE